jgi:hypothetical protein
MAALDVTVVDSISGRQRPADLPDDAPIGRVVARLVEVMGLPASGPDGTPLSYRFHHKATGRQLGGTETLASAGVQAGDTLRLTLEIIAG